MQPLDSEMVHLQVDMVSNVHLQKCQWINVLLRSQETPRKYVNAALLLGREITILIDLYCSSSVASARPVGTVLQTVIVIRLL